MRADRVGAGVGARESHNATGRRQGAGREVTSNLGRRGGANVSAGIVGHPPAGSERPFATTADLRRERDRVARELARADRRYEKALRHPRAAGVEDACAELRGLARRLKELDAELEGRVSSS